jgi:hypothetical protein
MQLGITFGDVGWRVGEENPALSVEAPLSTTRVCAGGGGPEDLVLRCEGAIEDLRRCE